MWPLGWRSITYFIRGLSYLSFLISLLLLTIEVSGLETRDGSINSPAIHTRNSEPNIILFAPGLCAFMCFKCVHFNVCIEWYDLPRSVTGSGCVEDCSCHGEGRCKPCSRFEMGRQVHGCLRTGYRQWAYCSQEKISKYVR